MATVSPLSDDPYQERVTRISLRVIEDGRPQYKIAAELGVPAPRLSEYCLGKRPIPMRKIYRFCEVFQCDPTDLIGYEDVHNITIP